jgi:glycosyltransferase involved in cell wall biosynthesis
MKKRILFLRRPPWCGGAELRLVETLAAIDYSKCDVWLAYSKDVFSSRLKARGVPVICTPLELSVEGGFWKILFSWWSYLRKMRLDKIILGDGHFLEWPLPTVLAAYLASSGNVYMQESTPSPEAPIKASRKRLGFIPGLGLWWYRIVLPLRARAYLSKRVIATSDGFKKWIVDSYGYPQEKVTVVRHGVDSSRFHRADPATRCALRREFQVAEDAEVIVSTARMDRNKHVEQIVRAFDTLSQKRKNLWLLLAGEGPKQDEAHALATSSHARDRIRFLGHLEDVSPVLQASNIYVLASGFEGLGNALLEAMASELVCVSTRTQGPSGVIVNGKNGILVDASYEGVLDGMRQALQLGATEREVMRKNARQTILDSYQLGDSVEKTLAALEIPQVDGRPAV